MLAPEDAIGDGPYIYIAVPEAYIEFVPANATRVLREWEAQIDPVAGLKQVATRTLRSSDGWGWGRWFVEPSMYALELARAAVKDDELADLMANVQGTLVVDESARPDVGKPLRRFLTVRRGEYRELTGLAMPLLLGLGVIAAIDSPIGYHSNGVAVRMLEALSDSESESESTSSSKP